MLFPEEFVFLQEGFFFPKGQNAANYSQACQTLNSRDMWSGRLRRHITSSTFLNFVLQMELLKWSHSLMCMEQRPGKRNTNNNVPSYVSWNIYEHTYLYIHKYIFLQRQYQTSLIKIVEIFSYTILTIYIYLLQKCIHYTLANYFVNFSH